MESPVVALTWYDLAPWIAIMALVLGYAIYAAIMLQRSMGHSDELYDKYLKLDGDLYREQGQVIRLAADSRAWSDLARDYQIKYSRACAVIRSMRKRMQNMIRASDVEGIRQAHIRHWVEKLTARFWSRFRDAVATTGRTPSRMRLLDRNDELLLVRDPAILGALELRLQLEVREAGYPVRVEVLPAHWLLPTSVKVLLLPQEST